MKPFEYFIVELKSRFKDTMKLDNGLELYIDTKFNEFDHRTVEGEIVATPFKYDTGAKAGDTLYFHHHVVVQKAQPLPLEDAENQYLVRYDDNETLACQAIAYKDSETGELNTVGGWLLLEEIEEEEETKTESGIELVSLTKKDINCGRFTKHNKKSEFLDVKEGDIVYFRPNIAYQIKIDGKKYLRMRPDDLMYVKE